MKIGLLTLPLHDNVGGVLQAAALYRVLSGAEKGEIILLERQTIEIERSFTFAKLNRIAIEILCNTRTEKLISVAQLGAEWLTRSTLTSSTGSCLRLYVRRLEEIRKWQLFKKKYLKTRSGPINSKKQMMEYCKKMELNAVVVGSDQVWRFDYIRDEEMFMDYFLKFDSRRELKRIAYAASFGLDDWAYGDYTGAVRRELNLFDRISVREVSGKKIVSEVFGRNDAVLVLDPTLIVDEEFYSEICEKRSEDDVSKKLLYYVLDENSCKRDLLLKIQRTLCNQDEYKLINLEKRRAPPNVGSWVTSFMQADYVLTDSFHGMVMSILFKKKFTVIINEKRGRGRIISLLAQLGLETRCIEETAKDISEENINAVIDYFVVNKKLDELRIISMEYLMSALS